MLDLQDESAGLATRGVAQVVVVQINLFAALKQVIEVIGHYSLAFGVARKAASATDELGNEAASRLVGRHDSFVDTKEVQLLEVKVTGLEYAHDLQTISLAAVHLQACCR